MRIQQNQKVIISPDVLFQEVSGEIVLLDLASESYFGLDEIGARIWVLLNEGKAVGHIVKVLLAEYEVDRARLEKDVDDLLENLQEAGLIRMQEPAAKHDQTLA